jgi:thioredoxin-like negative regulator of GroEL
LVDEDRPRLVFFHSQRSGTCRRAEAHLAQVLQRRGNHETFAVLPVAQEERPDLFERFHVTDVPTIVVVESAKLKTRLEKPRGTAEIEAALSRWLH